MPEKPPMMHQFKHLSSGAPEVSEDHLARLLAGRKAWNRWAEALLEERDALISQGKWQIERLWHQQSAAILGTSNTPETEDWLKRARVDFSGLAITSRVRDYLDKRGREKSPASTPNHLLILEGEHIDLRGFIFPGEVLFSDCTFKAKLLLDDTVFMADAIFNSARFEAPVSLDHTRFYGDAWFENTNFAGSFSAEHVIFHLAAWFNHARFQKKLKFRSCLTVADFWLNEASVKGRAIIENCIFKSDFQASESSFKNHALFSNVGIAGSTGFRETRFGARASFKNMTCRQAALFTACDFAGYTIFNNTNFKKAAQFKAIHVSKGLTFEDVAFETEVPNFRQALLTAPARFKRMAILPPPRPQPYDQRVKTVLKAVKREKKWLRRLFFYDRVSVNWLQDRLHYSWCRFTNARRKPTDESYYNTLMRLARGAENLGAEKNFEAGRIHARRHLKDRLTAFPSGTISYLTGLVSELTSNHGRSLLRPVASWAVLFAIFTGIYLFEATNPLTSPCQNRQEATPVRAAQTIALKNAFGLNWQTKGGMSEMHRCLYGEIIVSEKESKDQTRLAGLDNVPIAPPPPVPKVPFKVTMWGALHTLLSFMLIGLLVLNVRNRLRM